MIMLLPTLLLATLPGPGSAGPLSPTPSYASAQDESYEELEDAYSKAALKWRSARRAARRDKTEFTEPNPAIEYFPRFEALAAAGSLEALAWTGELVHLVEDDDARVRTRKREIFQRLVADHGARPEIGPVLKTIAKQEKWLEKPAGLAELFTVIAKRNTDDRVRAKAALRAAMAWEKGRSEEATARAEELHRMIVEEFPESPEAEKAATRLTALSISVGKIAPDFETEDVDGNAFKLSDYRGKVVVLDFWGFW